MTSGFVTAKPVFSPGDEFKPTTDIGKMAMYAWWIADGIKNDNSPANIKGQVTEVNKYLEDLKKSAKDGAEDSKRLLDSKMKINGKEYKFEELVEQLNTIYGKYKDGKTIDGDFSDAVANSLRILIALNYQERNEIHIEEIEKSKNPDKIKQRQAWIKYDLGVLEEINKWENSRADIPFKDDNGNTIKLTRNEFKSYKDEVLNRADMDVD